MTVQTETDLRLIILDKGREIMILQTANLGAAHTRSSLSYYTKHQGLCLCFLKEPCNEEVEGSMTDLHLLKCQFLGFSADPVAIVPSVTELEQVCRLGVLI